MTQARPPDSRPGERARRRPRAGLVIQLLALAGVAALLVTKSSTLAESVSALGNLRWRWLPLILLAEFSSMGAVARGYRRLLRAGGRAISLPALLAVTYASNAISVTLPLAGSGVATGFSFRQFNRRGVDAAAAGWALLLSGIAATTAFALLTVLGLAATGRRDGVLVAVAGGLVTVAPAALAVLALRRKDFRTRIERVVARVIAWAQRLTRRGGRDLVAASTAFIERLGELRLSTRDGTAVFGLAVWNWAADCVCLIAALKAVGAHVPWHGVLLAYVVGMGVGSLNLTPGGIGVVEVALTSALVANGLPAREALAAVLLYRLVSLWLVVLMGWGAFLYAGRDARRQHPVVPGAVVPGAVASDLEAPAAPTASPTRDEPLAGQGAR